MEIKKSEKANVNNRKGLFVEIGFMAALTIVLCSFEYSSKEGKVPVLQPDEIYVDEEDNIPITMETPPEMPEVPKIPVFSEIIDIVPDDIPVESMSWIDEDDPNLGVTIEMYKEKVDEEYMEDESIPIFKVEEKPSFNGKDANEFAKWVNEHVNYPEIAKQNGIQGRVMLQFAVGADGKVCDVAVLRGVDPLLDAEAVKVVSSSPKWRPGRQRDRCVKVTYTFPVTFQLR